MNADVLIAGVILSGFFGYILLKLARTIENLTAVLTPEQKRRFKQLQRSRKEREANIRRMKLDVPDPQFFNKSASVTYRGPSEKYNELRAALKEDLHELQR